MDRRFADSFLSTMHQINRMTRKRSSYGVLPRAEFFILSFIDMSGRDAAASPDAKTKPTGISVTKLATMLGISTAAASKHLRNVEAKGYISRMTDDRDRRFVYISLTEKGETLILQARKDAQDRILLALKKMGEEDSADLLRLLTRLLDTLDESEPHLEIDTLHTTQKCEEQA